MEETEGSITLCARWKASFREIIEVGGGSIPIGSTGFGWYWGWGGGGGWVCLCSSTGETRKGLKGFVASLAVDTVGTTKVAVDGGVGSFVDTVGGRWARTGGGSTVVDEGKVMVEEVADC